MGRSSVPKLRGALKKSSPGTRHERMLWSDGVVVAGVDEVGRGAWAGPLTVAAAVIPSDRRIYKVRDSKLLTESEREMLFGRIVDWCTAWAVGHASEVECDELGMSTAQRLAARRALDHLGIGVDHVLIDGKWDFVDAPRTTTIVKGDARCLSIASASIIAKVTRDRMMRLMADTYPVYGFEHNKGYPCPKHKRALAEAGPSEVHRHTWAFVDDLPTNAVKLRGRPQPDSQASF